MKIILAISFVVAKSAHLEDVVREAPYSGEGFGFPASFVAPSGKEIRFVQTPIYEPSQTSASPNRVAENNLMGKNSETQSLGDWVSSMRARADNTNETFKIRAHRENRRQTNVILPDDRLRMSPTQMNQYPARCVGLLVVGSSLCTATVVNRFLILTNRHCLGVQNDELPSGIWNSNMEVGHSDNSNNFRIKFRRVLWSSVYDYAILQSTEPIGDHTGWPGIIYYTASSFKKRDFSLSYIGYSYDVYSASGRPSAHFQCRSRGVTSESRVLHDCDTAAGSSGSALMSGVSISPDGQLQTGDGPYIIALNFAELRPPDSTSPYILNTYVKQYSNIAEPASVLHSAIEDARLWSHSSVHSSSMLITAAGFLALVL